MTRITSSVLIIASVLLLTAQQPDTPPEELAALKAFADPARLWKGKAERSLEEAYRLCFRTKIIGGKIMMVRLPFAENHERDGLVEGGWEVPGKGKAPPLELWRTIERALVSEDFRRYTETLGDGREKVIQFDISQRTWGVSEDVFDIAQMKAGMQRSLPHAPRIFSEGRGIEEADVYNYLYCVSWAGLDCSAFVWHALSYATSKNGGNLQALIRRTLRLPQDAQLAYYAGTDFFGSRNSELSTVDDKVKNLKPGDIILFRAADGTMAHSAVVQSVDLKGGRIRYLQCTDEAPLSERGVHESFISFPPDKSALSLKDAALEWTQERRPPFPGEKPSAYQDDGARYRAFGGGKVVRLKQAARLLGV